MTTRRSPPRRLSPPLVAGVAGFFVGAAMVIGPWFAAHVVEKDGLDKSTAFVANQFARQLKSCVDVRVALVAAMARERGLHGLLDEESFRRRADGLIELMPGYLAINEVDVDGVIIRVHPVAGNESAYRKNIKDHPGARAHWRATNERRAPQITVPIELFQGGRGFASYAPILDDDNRPIGTVNGVFRTQTIVESCLGSGLTQGFDVFVDDDGAAVFASSAIGTSSLVVEPAAVPRDSSSTVRAPVDGRAQSSVLIPVVNRTWRVRVWPDDVTLRARAGPGRALLAVGLVLSALIAFLIFTTLRDRARRAERDAESGEAARRLAAVVETSRDLVAIVDEAGELTYLNPAGRRFFGLGDDAALPDRLDPMLATSPSSIKSNLERASVEGRAEFEGVVGDANRAPRQLSLIVVPMRDETAARITGYAVIGRDLTHLRTIEQKLEQARRAEAIGRLAGGVAHDFNNFLTLIMVNARLLKDDAKDPDTRLYAEEIESEALRASRLTRQLLTLGTQEGDDDGQPTDVGVVADNLRQLLRKVVKSSTTLTIDVETTPSVVIATDVDIERIFTNLITNASDAIKENGGKIAVSVQKLGPDVVIRVKDDGVGMTAETQARLFEPFFTTKDIGKGTGLGLATVFRVVQRWGGRVDVESRLDHGTTFSVVLPAHTSVDESGPNRSRPRGHESSHTTPLRRVAERILLVDDDGAVRRVTRRILVGAGYDVLESEDPEDAIEKLGADTAHAISCVVSDVVMPRGGVATLVNWLNTHRPDLPMLMLSGFSGDSRESEAFRRTGGELVQKPFSAETLRDGVARAISRRRSGPLVGHSVNRRR